MFYLLKFKMDLENNFNSDNVLSNYQSNTRNRMKKNILIFIKIIYELTNLILSLLLLCDNYDKKCNSALHYSLIIIVVQCILTIFIVLDKFIVRKFKSLRSFSNILSKMCSIVFLLMILSITIIGEKTKQPYSQEQQLQWLRNLYRLYLILLS